MNLTKLGMAIVVAAIAIATVAFASDIEPCRAEPATLQAVRLRQIELDGFWLQQGKRLIEKWLPHCIAQMEPGGAGQELANLIAAGQVIRGEPHGRYTGAPWSDAYIYNTLEAVCLALAIDARDDGELAAAQARLSATLDQWIPIILAAQLPDGYLHSFHTVHGHPRFSNIGWHEFYVMGYFLELGVAHYRATAGRDRRLYDAAIRCADQLDRTFGPPPKRTWKNGHPGLEYALCRLARLVDEVAGPGAGARYARLAKFFLDHQHELEPNSYDQSNLPAIEMVQAEGHAVRATYFYTAMADLALMLDDPAYGDAVDRLWTNAIQRKHYLTGGVGASPRGEAFGADFDLCNDGYCESCASCGLSFWAARVHRLRGDGHFVDVQERVLYNNLLGAVDLAGENFFYQNPLASDHPRYAWHGCPCCVGNIPRTLLSIKDLMYSTNSSRDTLYVNHFVGGKATIADFVAGPLGVRQETEYPWKGEVQITLWPPATREFELRLRIPRRTESELYTAEPDVANKYCVSINGQTQKPEIEKGYVVLRRAWQPADKVVLSLPLDVQRVRCDERVAANRGRVAVQRGPLTYSVEDVDHAIPASHTVLKPDAALRATWQPDLLGGVMAIDGPAFRAIPNYARLNRGGGAAVWMVEDPERAAAAAATSRSPRPEPPSRPDLDPRTVDRVAIGHFESELQHDLQGQRTASEVFRDRPWRHADVDGWFSYRLAVKPNVPQSVHVVYWGSEQGARRFDILVDGQKIADQALLRNRPETFFDAEYPIPRNLVQDKDNISVRLQARPGAMAGGVFDLRIVEVKR